MMLFTRLVDFTIRTCHQAFEIAAQFRFSRKGHDPAEIGRGALVEIMKATQLLQGKLCGHVGLETMQHRFEFGPIRPLGGDEFSEINDHKSCRCFTLRYCVTRSAVSRSFSSSEKSTPRRCRTFCNSRRLCHCIWPRKPS